MVQGRLDCTGHDMHGPLTELASRFVFCYFITIYYVYCFRRYTVESQESRNEDSTSLRLGVMKIGFLYQFFRCNK